MQKIARKETDGKDYDVYKPLFEGMTLYKSSITLYNIQFLIRRLVLLFTALFLSDQSWIQIIFFVASSQLSSIYFCYSMPFESRVSNIMEIINEFMILSLGAVSMCLISMGISVEERQVMSRTLCYVIYLKLAVNFTLIVMSTSKSIYFAIKKRK